MTPEEFLSDIKPSTSTATMSPEDFLSDIKRTEKPKKSILAESISNIPSSGISYLKNVITPLIHPLNTIDTILDVVVGGIEKIFPSQKLSTMGQELSLQRQQTFDLTKDYFKTRFGSAEGIKDAIRTDPVGVVADLASVLGIGGALMSKAGKAGELATIAKAGKMVSKAGEFIEPLPLVTKVVGETLAGTAGVVSGRPYQAFIRAFRKPDESLTMAMRGKTSGQEIVDNALSGLEKIKENRRNAYTKQLEVVKNIDNEIDLMPIQDKLTELIGKYNIKIGDEGLDFSRSPLNKSARNDIQEIVNDVASWGTQAGDRTAIGLDILKRRIGDFYSPSGEARAFASQMYDTVKQEIVKNVPEYQRLVGGYEDASKTIKDMKSSLSLGGKAGVETTLKKLIFVMNDNNEFRKSLVDELEKSGATGLTSQIAGERLSQVLPGGLAKLTTTGGMVGGAYAIGKGLINPAYLGTLALASPRLMGEFLRALGLTNKVVTMNLLNIYGDRGVSVGQAAFQAGRLANESGRRK